MSLLVWRCPCLVCPTCGRPQAPHPHPTGTGSARCDLCGTGWEVPRGPGITDRHPVDHHEAAAWAAYDARLAAAEVR